MIENGSKPYILSPKNDYVFRFLFGEEGNEDILISLLSAILGREGHQATIKNPYLMKFYRETKECILDIKAEIDDKVQVDIEIQLNNHPGLINRVLLYWSRLFASQLQEGDGYHVLKKTISVIILDGTGFTQDEFHAKYRLKDFVHSGELTDLIEIHTVELPKIHKLREQDRDTIRIHWMNFLNAQTRGDLEMAAEANTAIKKATDILMSMSRDEEARLRYEAREEFLFDQQYSLQEAERKGREEGRVEGKEVGRIEGKEEGRAEGIKSNKQEIAKILIQKGMEEQFIQEITGLDIEEIRAIWKNV
jgi:predicted transposase/invertase (TIGR01784 family)